VDSRALLAGVLGKDAVAAEAAACAELAQLCGGLPLALRIAAANIATVPGAGIAALVAELAKGDRLAGFAMDGAADSAVTAAFSASYRALKPGNQQVFRSLALIAGPDFTVPAAAAASGLSLVDAGKALKALAAAHLIEQHTADRYRFHDLVRLYAAHEARTDPEQGSARDRLTSYYVGMANAASQRYEPDILRLPGNPIEPTEHVAAEVEDLPNLAAALLDVAAHGPYPAAWWLADDLRVVYQRNGRRSEWLELAPVVLEAARAHGECEVQAMLYHSMGAALFRAGQRDQAVQQMNVAAAYARECGWPEGEAASLADLSFALEWTGRLAESIEHNQKAAALFAELGSVVGENRTLNALGGQYHHLGRLRLAEDSCRQALDISRRHGLRMAMANDLRDLGSVLLDRGQYAEAEECLTQARAVFAELGSHDMGTLHTWLSRLRLETGDYDGALAEALRAVDVARSEGDQLVAAAALVALADAEIGLVQYARAEENLDLADGIIEHSGLRWHLAYALIARSRLDAGYGNYDLAAEHASQARLVARQSGYRPPELAAVSELARIHAYAGQRELAAVAVTEALDLCRDAGHAPCDERLLPLLTWDGTEKESIRK
jgi:tetratricopeptide (TPR) repeat protein